MKLIARFIRHRLKLLDAVGIGEGDGELLGTEEAMGGFWLLLEKDLPAFCSPFAQLCSKFFGLGLAVQGVLQADALALQSIAIAVQPFLDVGGCCFVRPGMNDQPRPLALQGLNRPL